MGCARRCRWLVNKGTQLCMLCVLHAWGVDMSECALRQDKRKDLLVPVDAWMQMCCWRCRWLVNMGTQVHMLCVHGAL